MEGGVEDAIQNSIDIIGKAPSRNVDDDEDEHWDLGGTCDTLEKQKAVGRMLATNACNGTLM